MNWLLILLGFVVGTFFGANIAIFVAGMCAAAHKGDQFIRSHG
jgi:hypothetical protein